MVVLAVGGFITNTISDCVLDSIVNDEQFFSLQKFYTVNHAMDSKFACFLGSNNLTTQRVNQDLISTVATTRRAT